MGAYFTLRTAKKLPLFDAATSVTTDAKVTLRSGKVMAKAFAASFEGEQRESVARTFTTAVLETYWSKIQENAVDVFPLPALFAIQKNTDLPVTALTLASTMGEAASVLEPLAAAYLISATYTAMLPDDTRSRLGAYYTPPAACRATRTNGDARRCQLGDMPSAGPGVWRRRVSLRGSSAFNKSGRRKIACKISL